MSDANAPKSLRDRLAGTTEDRLGKALADLFESPLLNGALGRASDAREKAAQAQELAMGALNLPSGTDIERLTRRLRSVSQRLEGIEDGVHRIGRTLSGQAIETRLAGIEEQLKTLSGRLEPGGRAAAAPSAGQAAAKQTSAEKPAAKPSAKRPGPKRTAAKRAPAKAAPAKRAPAKRPKPAR
jgi:TolA-binding protein